jgi:hypothetical protein
LTKASRITSAGLPSPSWPELFAPQHHAIPSVAIAQVWDRPAPTGLHAIAAPDPLRATAVGRRAIAKLTGSVLSPAVQLIGGGDVARMKGAD